MEVKVKTQPNPSIIKGYSFDPRIATMLGLDISQLTDKEKEKLAFLTRYVASQTDDEIQQLNIIRDLKFRLGTPQIGQDWLDHIHKYIKLREAAKINEMQAKEMENANSDFTRGPDNLRLHEAE
ncbi:MAG: hypothetical protein D6822_00175 [Cyanobacteria bacterium J149]|nr:MAG: hypothetical protein D6822_00175 [Cyanobacteria bacterium J149]